MPKSAATKAAKSAAAPAAPTRLAVRKTYKLYVGGAFPRSESGRTYLVDGDNVALASRKDARDAVVAARKAQPRWAGATAYNRGQVVYRIAREEIFGPVLSVLTFRTPDEAIEKANNTPYGLSAGIWTEKGSRILAMADKLRAGVVWANTFNKFDPTSPFGGYKESGYGREGGRHGLEAYLEH